MPTPLLTNKAFSNKIGLIMESWTMKRTSTHRECPRERIIGVRFLQEMCRTYLGVSERKHGVEPALTVLKENCRRIL